MNFGSSVSASASVSESDRIRLFHLPIIMYSVATLVATAETLYYTPGIGKIVPRK